MVVWTKARAQVRTSWTRERRLGRVIERGVVGKRRVPVYVVTLGIHDHLKIVR